MFFLFFPLLSQEANAKLENKRELSAENRSLFGRIGTHIRSVPGVRQQFPFQNKWGKSGSGLSARPFVTRQRDVYSPGTGTGCLLTNYFRVGNRFPIARGQNPRCWLGTNQIRWDSKQGGGERICRVEKRENGRAGLGLSSLGPASHSLNIPRSSAIPRIPVFSNRKFDNFTRIHGGVASRQTR